MMKCHRVHGVYWRLARRMIAVTALVVFLTVAGSCIAADPATPLPVRIGSQSGASRLIFDWPKMTGYKVEKAGNTLKIIFETPADAKIPSVDPTLNPQIKSIRATSPTEIVIELADGATLAKDFRIVRKIVLDIGGGPAPAQATASPATAAPPQTPTPKAAAKPVPPKTTPKKTTPAKPPAEQKETPPAPPAVPVEAVQKDLPVAAAATPVPPDAPQDSKKTPAPGQKLSAQENPAGAQESEKEAAAEENSGNNLATTISLSTLEPAGLAVFRRNGFLWVITDTSTGGIPPHVYGPLGARLGNPRRIDIEGGSAFRFTDLSDEGFIITKQNLSWQIVFRSVGQKTFSHAQLRPEFDPPGDTNGRLAIEISPKGKILKLDEPSVGDRLIIVPAQEIGEKIDQNVRMADLEILPSDIGLVLRPLRDNLKVDRREKDKALLITAPGGLFLTPGASAIPVAMDDKDGPDNAPRLFDFPNWRQGGIKKLDENKRLIEQEILFAGGAEQRSEGLLRLALLYFANNFSHEALGILKLALAENPKLAENPGYVALRGAARALAGQYQDALNDLSIPALNEQSEASLWKGYAAAATEQWRMAAKLFPKSNRLLTDYPSNIAIPFTIYMAESALRLGEKDRAKELLATLNAFSDEMPDRYQASILYLNGEALRQDGDTDKALDLWRRVESGRDRLYRAKANLASTNLLLDKGRIELKDAIEKIDSLRFAWRDDGLEASILHTLGAFKIRNNQYLDGLKDLRAAIIVAEGSREDSEPIAADMAQAFEDLFLNDKASHISPLEAVAIFDEFKNLLPAGDKGNQATRNFAEYLIRMDLLDRAASMLEDQVKNHSEGLDRSMLGSRLASVYLLNSLPLQALDTLKESETPGMSQAMIEERKLLAARAWFQQNRMDMAVSSLAGLETPDALRLMADIFWRTQKWTEAADTIQKLLPSAPTEPLDEEAASLVVNAAVALKLGKETDRLQLLKDKYQKAMTSTKRSQIFGVITREPGKTGLADRATMMKIVGEVDMFKGFLSDYNATTSKGGN